ncbi:TRAP transporter substrate-binding protein DctP [Pseudoruegeria sp. SK021]|uniref:TRAP transporter substrate-binding protein DctP n=1 Tax=Pseudoruegeria sp. SK021 TaxID=1933035 RepID=UPI000A265C03|nr:TRAP transporter substrate-binding protein DctP [Pseudoruegeria sp. SK021]OSP55605.1 hypothetical protein BV911_07005 [Pseudoruegeria sp. SK021]
MTLRTTVAIAALLVGANTASANTRLLVNCFWPSSHFACSEILPGWLDEVERVTDGRVKGNIPPNSVAPPPDQLSSVENGIVDVAVQFNGLIANRVQGPLVAMQPFIGTHDAEQMSRALWATNRAYFPDEFDSVQLLSQFVISPGELYSQTSAPITSIADLTARKMWALPGPLAEILKQLGSGVVSTPAVAASEIISRGVVDGHIGLDPQALQAFQLMPYTKSNTAFEAAVYTTSFSVVMNANTWASISPEDQEAIMSISGDVLGASFGARWNAAAAVAEAAYPEAGLTVVQADPAFEAALVDASAFVTEGWIADATATGIDAQAALGFYQAQLAE